MYESLDEFFSDEIVTDSGVHDEASLIHDYLAGKLTVEAVVQRLEQSLRARDALLRNGHYDLSEVLEAAVVSVAESLQETHDALVTLLGPLKQLSDRNEFESDLRYSLEERSLRYSDPDSSLSSRDEARQSWINLNHFTALVYKAGLQDLSALGIKTLSMSLKRGGWPVNWPGESSSDSIIALEVHVPAAAQWIILCGQRLHDESSEAREKWVTWGADLQWIAGQSMLYDTTKSLCQQAIARMQRIEA